MENTEFKKIVQESTRKYGFKYYKKNYYCNLEDMIVIINLQKSNFENSFYINYGFCVKELHNNLQYPKNNECDIIGRFVNETNTDNYQLDVINSEELLMSLEKNISKIIVPVINEGISKYFELFPNAICRATLSLKKYLGIN